MKNVIVVLSLLMTSLLAALEIKRDQDQFTVSAKRVQLTVKDARIIAVNAVATGKALTEAAPGMSMLAAGLGNMEGLGEELSRVHFPWGEPSVKQDPKRKETPLYGVCGEQTVKTFDLSEKQIKASWKGLYFDGKFYPEELIELIFQEDENGAIVMQRSGSGRAGLFGMSVPVENLPAEGKIFLPSFGGLEYDASSDKEELISLQDTTLFIEAPLMIYVRAKSALAMWVEDDTFRPYFGFIERGPNGAAFTLEAINIMPYEVHQKINPPAVKFDLFDNAGWIAAARPYRNWYQKTFAKEIAVRDGKSWADSIMVIADGGNQAPGYKDLLKVFDPKNVLVQIWQARKLGFTKDIPDYTPRDHYPGLVSDLHESGFKVMCYVCPLCAVYRCPAWERDKVGEFFLTRKNSITKYNGNENAFDENLVGTIRAAKGEDQYANLEPNAFLYGDPLSKGWRDYFCAVIKEMNDKCGTDANYQDTLGCTADVGNGYVDGLSGAQGNAVFTRELQEKLKTPMAAEFGPAAIAFGIRWPINGARSWGGERFRKYRNSRQHPISPFIFGYRTWVTSNRLWTDEVRHTVLAASDSLSGFGLIPTSIPIQMEYGYMGQLLLRAKLFADKMLLPFYPENEYPENIHAMYQDKEGKVYSYYDDGTIQKMLDPKGKPLYGRLHGASNLIGDELLVPRYPIWDAKGVYGLDPENFYALFPRGAALPTAINTGQLPDGVTVKGYYDTPDYAYMELAATDSYDKQPISLNVDRRFSKVIINDIEMSCPEKLILKEKFPLRLVFFKGECLAANETRIVNHLSGLQDGEPAPLPTPRKIGDKLFYSVNYSRKKHVNSIFKVESTSAALEFSMINLQDKYGDGAIVELYINGELIKAFDCATYKGKGRLDENNYIFDNRCYTWTVPLGKYLGNHIFVSAVVDCKLGSNADSQFISIPKLISDSKQVFLEQTSDLSADKSKRPDAAAEDTLLAKWKNNVERKDKPGLISSSNFIQLDPDKQYFISGRFRSVDDEAVSVTFGLIQYDSNGQLHGVHVNTVPQTYSMLSHVARKGEDSLLVFDASKWVVKGMVALDASEDESDLPNRKLIGPVTDIKLMGGDYKVTLAKPLEEGIPSETKVRQHYPRDTFEYVKRISAKKEWTPGGGMLQVLPKAKRAQFLIISDKPIIFEDVKAEVFPKK